MAGNLTWCLMRNIIRKSNLMKTRCLSIVNERFKHTTEGDDALQNPNNIDYREVKSYKQFLNESKACPQSAIDALMKTLNVTKENATEIVDNWKIFGTLSTATIMRNNDLLRQAGANKSTLRDNMFALADTPSNVKKKIQSLKLVELEINSCIPLFQLPSEKLGAFVITTKQDRQHLIEHVNRISYLSERLNQDIYTLCVTLCNASYILSVPITKLIQVTEYMLEIGVLGENIMRDLMVYRYSTPTIKKRFELARQKGVKTLKPWVVRCPTNIIEKIGSKMETRRRILPSRMQVTDYIVREFNCDSASVEALFKRDPTIEAIDIEKLSASIKALRDCHYTIEDIYRAPNAMHSRDETIKKRYNIWIQHSKSKPPLFAIVMSDKVFNARLKRELKNKK